MASVVALIGISPLIGLSTTANNNGVVYASAYRTTGNNKVKVIKSTSFVNNRGVKQAISAEKGGSYTVYAVNYIGGTAYVSVHKSNRYWLPVSALKGKISYQRGDNATYVINAGNGSSTVSSQANSLGNITLKSNAYVYNSKGKRINNDLGKYFISKGASLPYYGVRTISGKKYYDLGNGQFVKAGNVSGSSSAGLSKAQVKIAPKSATPTDYSKPTLTLKKNAYPYNSEGKRINNYLGFTYIKKGTTINYQTTKKINGQLYYYIGDGAYIKSANVGSVSNSNTDEQSNTITLSKKSYAYTASGKRMANYLGYTYINKGAVLNYYGTKKINGKTYYYIGDHAYVNAANVGSVNNE